MAQGLQLAREFYFDCVQPIIAKRAPEIECLCAAGLIGYGSDVLGNDDDLSRDHEWGPRLLLFLPSAKYAEFADPLDQILSESLPSTFQGFSTKFIQSKELFNSNVMSDSPDGRHHVVITTPERFLELQIGHRNGPQEDLDWLCVPEQRLLEIVSGEIFHDPTGEVTSLRQSLSNFPDNVWKYRLAYAFESLAWDHDLIAICGKRGDTLSMHLNVASTVARVMKLGFLLNRKYAPGYPKWLHREFVKLPMIAGEIESHLRDAFALDEWVKIMGCLDRSIACLYRHLKKHPEFSQFPERMARMEHRGINVADTQAVAQSIMATIEGSLKNLRICAAPYGAVDQWVTNQDILIHPGGLGSFRVVYAKSDMGMDRFDQML